MPNRARTLPGDPSPPHHQPRRSQPRTASTPPSATPSVSLDNATTRRPRPPLPDTASTPRPRPVRPVDPECRSVETHLPSHGRAAVTHWGVASPMSSGALVGALSVGAWDCCLLYRRAHRPHVFLDAQRAAIARKLSDLSDGTLVVTPTASALVTLGDRQTPRPRRAPLVPSRRRGPDATCRASGRSRTGSRSIALTTTTPSTRRSASTRRWWRVSVDHRGSASPDAACRHPDAAQWSLRLDPAAHDRGAARHAGHADIIRESIDGAIGV